MLTLQVWLVCLTESSTVADADQPSTVTDADHPAGSTGSWGEGACTLVGGLEDTTGIIGAYCKYLLFYD